MIEKQQMINILQPAKKLGIILLLLVQVFRFATVGVTLYFVFASLYIHGKSVLAFEPPGGNVTFASYDDGSDKEYDEFKTTRDYISIALPSVEVVLSLLFIYIVMGPLSPRVTYSAWFKWLIRLRMYWMRVIWLVTAVVYAALLLKLRKTKYDLTLEPRYKDSPLVIVGLVLTALEYGCLGIVESVMKVMKVETLERRLHTYNSNIVGSWKKQCMLIYYLAVLAFALRSFSMALYFGMLSTVDLSAPQDHKLIWTAEMRVLEGLILVLQIYIAIIRGKFYSFFMQTFLSNFFWEVDDEKLQSELQGKLVDDQKEKRRDCGEDIRLVAMEPKTVVS